MSNLGHQKVIAIVCPRVSQLGEFPGLKEAPRMYEADLRYCEASLRLCEAHLRKECNSSLRKCEDFTEVGLSWSLRVAQSFEEDPYF